MAMELAMKLPGMCEASVWEAPALEAPAWEAPVDEGHARATREGARHAAESRTRNASMTQTTTSDKAPGVATPCVHPAAGKATTTHRPEARRGGSAQQDQER